MGSRFVISGTWSEPYVDDRSVNGPYSIEECDLRDKRSGTVYPGGAKRVVKDGRPVRGCLFKGETAWMDAARRCDDLNLAHARSTR